jgi:hypothetical protein
MRGRGWLALSTEMRAKRASEVVCEVDRNVRKGKAMRKMQLQFTCDLNRSFSSKPGLIDLEMGVQATYLPHGVLSPDYTQACNHPSCALKRTSPHTSRPAAVVMKRTTAMA